MSSRERCAGSAPTNNSVSLIVVTCSLGQLPQLPRDEFAKAVRGELRRVCADDGIDRLHRQRQATSLRSWVDRDTGMWCLHGEFDPETGLTLDRD